MVTQVAGKKWTRAHSVTIDNPYGGVPSISFTQEKMASFDDGQVVSLGNAGHIAAQMNDPTQQFFLYDPTNGEVVGTATYQQVYVMISSLYASLVGPGY